MIIIEENNSSYFNLNKIDKETIFLRKFNIYQATTEAKELLDNYSDIMVEKIKYNFDEGVWIFRDTFSRSDVRFDFNKTENLIRFSEYKQKEDLLIAIKCWIVKELNQNSVSVTRTKLTNINSFLYMSNVFKDINNLQESLKKSEIIRISKNKNIVKAKISEHVKFNFLTDLNSFLDFFSAEEFKSIINIFNDSLEKLKLETTYRELPSFQDVITIKYYLDRWYKEEKDLIEKLKYYPILIWWEITTIIPMRVTEFLHIERENIFKNNEGCFLTFPRMKKKRVKEIRETIDYDTLPIPLELFNLIQEYIEFSSIHGKSQYLISYKSFRKAFNLQVKYSGEEVIFNASDLWYLLSFFYKDILHKKYRISIGSVKRKLKSWKAFKYFKSSSLILSDSNGNVDSLIIPGDLRHLAIINMMMQGYDKVEIQRLSGHFTESTQFSYFNHANNWMNVEIMKMEKEYQVYKPFNKNYNNLHPKTVEFFEQQNKKEYLQEEKESHTSNGWIPLKLGACTDNTMPCPSFNWEFQGCYFCKHWSISNEEIKENQNLIVKDLNKIYNNSQDKVKNIKDIFQLKLDFEDNINDKLKKDLVVTSKELQQEIKKIAKLKNMLGVVDE